MPIENRNLNLGPSSWVGTTNRAIPARWWRMRKGSFATVWRMDGNSRAPRQPEWPSPDMPAMAGSSGVCKRTETAPAPDTENQAQTQQVTETTAARGRADRGTNGTCNRECSNCRETSPKKTGVFLVPNQKGVPEGQIRWFCRECGKSFMASAVEIPGVCPAKHQAS